MEGDTRLGLGARSPRKPLVKGGQGRTGRDVVSGAVIVSGACLLMWGVALFSLAAKMPLWFWPAYGVAGAGTVVFACLLGRRPKANAPSAMVGDWRYA